jgi:NADH-quinone oxidoreductase subunit E
MSVRRLAEDSVQPKSFAFAKKFESQVKTWIKKYPKGREQSAVIPLLMIAQEQEGWVSKPAIEHVGTMLGMAYIRVLEVATFYTQFQLKPVGTRAHVQVCGTTPCMLRGAEDLMHVCKSKIHHDQFHVNDKGTLSWEEVECLGACVNAPMVMIFKDTYEDLTPERLAEIIDEFEAGKGAKVPTGPQNGRVFSAPITGYTTLQNKKAISKAERQRLAKEYAKQSATKAAEAATAAAATLAPAAAPSEAAKPKTSAIETSPAIKTPSPVKVSAKVETAASAEPAPKTKGAAVRGLEEKKVAAGGGKSRAGKAALASTTADSASQLTGKDAVAPVALMAASKAKPAAAKPAAAKPATAKPAAAKTAALPKAKAESQPELLKKPRAGKGDDLKLIWGVGPKLEKMLNTMGIWHFDQIAVMDGQGTGWVDERLEGFKGRAKDKDRIFTNSTASMTGA